MISQYTAAIEDCTGMAFGHRKKERKAITGDELPLERHGNHLGTNEVPLKKLDRVTSRPGSWGRAEEQKGRVENALWFRIACNGTSDYSLSHVLGSKRVFEGANKHSGVGGANE